MTDDVQLPVSAWAGLAWRNATTQFDADAQAPAQARRMVRELCGDAGVNEGVCDMVVLLTSETVTNSVLHGRGPVHVHAETDSDRIRVEVGDSSRRPPVPASGGDVREHGRGLRLLAQCALTWGVDVRRRGKTVWFEVAAD
jgi:anti-sigma regulatory factor (Ser/Thr protein kinase)